VEHVRAGIRHDVERRFSPEFLKAASLATNRMAAT
jgi:hypothetical protein